MNSAIVLPRIVLSLVAAIAFTACSRNDPSVSEQSLSVPPRIADADLRSYGIEAGEDILRVKKDALRNRLWVLGVDDLRVYDSVSKTLIRQFVLPIWSVSGYVCEPDLALDKAGAALVASNASPAVVRIDADSFEVKVIEITLKDREQWDMGFGALAFARDGSLITLTSSGNSLWSIDIDAASAKLIALYEPPLAECAVPLSVLNAS